MELRAVLSPANGLFTNMPQGIWGPDFDPTFIDIELFTRIGKLDTSPLVDYYVQGGVLDTESLAKLLYQRYGANWKRIWDALRAEYDIMLTSTLDEKRSIMRDNQNTETRDLTETHFGTVGNKQDTSDTSIRTGSIARKGDNETTRDLSDLETRALTGSESETGTEKLSDVYDEATGLNRTLTYSGSEATRKDETETRSLNKKNTGSVRDSGSVVKTGTGTNVVDAGKYGVGGGGLANDTRTNDQETRNFTDATSNTRTDDTNESDSGTVRVDGTDTKTFTGRNDRTVDSGTHTGKVDHTTTFGKTTNTTDGGTLTSKQTGTEGTVEQSTETFNALTDSRTGMDNSTLTKNLTDASGGTVENAGNEKVEELFHSEGSSPLRTFQALIQEEITGRSGQVWNFTDIVIRDVQTMITSKIWRRRYDSL